MIKLKPQDVIVIEMARICVVIGKCQSDERKDKENWYECIALPGPDDGGCDILDINVNTYSYLKVIKDAELTLPIKNGFVQCVGGHIDSRSIYNEDGTEEFKVLTDETSH